MLDVHAVFGEPTLNELLAPGPAGLGLHPHLAGRLVTDETERDLVEPHLVPLADVELRMPFTVGDYVDFYASLDHASNVGRIFRPDQEPLLPNWRHLPVGYHGRGGTVVPSGTPVIRPQRPAEGRRTPTARSSGRAPGSTSRPSSASSSAPAPRSATRSRPMRSPTTSSASSASTTGRPATSRRGSTCRSGRSSASRSPPRSRRWVTPLAALDAAWIDLPGQDPEPLPYLAPGDTEGLDIDVEVVLNGEVVSRPPYRTMYWSPAQMLAHLTVNGASIRPGDLFASGTISGPEPDQRGSFLELSWGGKEPFGRRTHLPRGRRRGGAALHRTGHVRRPDRARRGRRTDRARPLVVLRGRRSAPFAIVISRSDPLARCTRPRAAIGRPSGPLSGTRQLGYSSMVPGWFCVRRSPTASVSATHRSRDGVRARYACSASHRGLHVGARRRPPGARPGGARPARPPARPRRRPAPPRPAGSAARAESRSRTWSPAR